MQQVYRPLRKRPDGGDPLARLAALAIATRGIGDLRWSMSSMAIWVALWTIMDDYMECPMSHVGGVQVPEFVAAIDQGTTSTRCMIFDHDGAEVARHQLEHEQILPRAGWVEHNPVEIWERTAVGADVGAQRSQSVAERHCRAGITNQRETTLVWNRRTGRPYYNAIVWQDTRTDRIASALDRDGRGDVIRRKAGLPPATYFSGGKLQWILENVDGVREAAERGDALFGTPDTWVLWNLTGGPRGGVHVTDVTNASRTMLMNLETLDWDDELLSFFSIPRAMLPTIEPSSSPAAVRRHARRPDRSAARCRSPEFSATSMRRWSVRCVWPTGRRKTPTAPVISCC